MSDAMIKQCQRCSGHGYPMTRKNGELVISNKRTHGGIAGLCFTCDGTGYVLTPLGKLHSDVSTFLRIASEEVEAPSWDETHADEEASRQEARIEEFKGMMQDAHNNEGDPRFNVELLNEKIAGCEQRRDKFISKRDLLRGMRLDRPALYARKAAGLMALLHSGERVTFAALERQRLSVERLSA